MDSFPLVLLFLATLINTLLALNCYSCGWDSGDTDESCLSDPSTVTNGVLVCDKRYCYSIRVEQSGSVSSIYRSCTDKPQYVNKLIKYDDFKIYHLACTTDLCNSGTGKEIYNSGSGSSGVLHVPGYGYKNGGSNTIVRSKCMEIISLIISVMSKFI